MTQIFCSLIRPILEYSSNAFHTILMAEQSEGLEHLQRKALKTIYGLDCPYRTCLEKSGIERLDERRDKLFMSFIEKSYTSARFGNKWFTTKNPPSYHLRNPDKIVQKFANCVRLQGAPLYLHC